MFIPVHTFVDLTHKNEIAFLYFLILDWFGFVLDSWSMANFFWKSKAIILFPTDVSRTTEINPIKEILSIKRLQYKSVDPRISRIENLSLKN